MSPRKNGANPRPSRGQQQRDRKKNIATRAKDPATYDRKRAWEGR